MPNVPCIVQKRRDVSLYIYIYVYGCDSNLRCIEDHHDNG